MSEDNKALANKAVARRSWETVDNLDAFEEIYPPDVVWHGPDQDIQSLEEARQVIAMYKTAFPDMNPTVEDVFAEGDKVVTRWTMRGTHQGEIEEFGPPPGSR
jgi:predicted ester cyclase